jgi:tetratricopeptide (TPR) repeat protein
MRRTKIFLGTFMLFGHFLLWEESARAKDNKYQVVDIGNNLQLNTPYGTRIYFGDVGFADYDNWRLEIPISDIRQYGADSNGKNSAAPGGGAGEGSPGKPFGSLEDNALLLSANDLYNQGKFRESLGFVEEMIRRDEKNIRAWIMRGSLYHALGQKDLAKTAWESARKLDPENKDVQRILENYR